MQPTRLPHSWDSPGKNIGVGCHFLLQCMKVKSESCSVVSNSQRPHGLQPTRLLRPWDSPGKSTGVGCHCLLRNGVYSQLIEYELNIHSSFILGEYYYSYIGIKFIAMKYMNNRHLKTETFTRKIYRKPIFKTCMSKKKIENVYL